ncbi:unnamed protein product [Eruca vesicaria subsp. sativa]|uniref:Uncharacterized protein n=1 Tax=Eruca vesicaria subsp. sativa TaxID=29727 RepID=A0ABC8IXF8_ERUVS|nr:unnamed protein product [Eruca vesicaria subsp. sativa]
MAAMRYKRGVLITIIFFSIVLSPCLLAHSFSTKCKSLSIIFSPSLVLLIYDESSFFSLALIFWLGEREDVKAMEKENEIGVGSATEVEERQVPTGSDPLHHKHVPFTSP